MYNYDMFWHSVSISLQVGIARLSNFCGITGSLYFTSQTHFFIGVLSLKMRGNKKWLLSCYRTLYEVIYIVFKTTLIIEYNNNLMCRILHNHYDMWAWHHNCSSNYEISPRSNKLTHLLGRLNATCNRWQLWRQHC